MTYRDVVAGVLVEGRRNAILSWIALAVVAGLAVERFASGDPRSAALGVCLLVLSVVPPALLRDPAVMLPWDLIGVAALPLLWHGFVGLPLTTALLPYLSIAALALIVVVELHAFTAFRTNQPFAILLVVLLTLAASSVWNVSLWLSDVLLGTSYLLDGRSADAINATVMIEMGYAVIAGLLAGVAFAFFFRHRVPPASERTAVPPRRVPLEGRAVEGRRLADRLHLSPTSQRRLVRTMQVVLVGLLAYGIVTLHVETVTNALVALAITFVPGMLERDLELPVDSGLALWITAAVFLHALGSAGLYGAIDPWDNLTHALSASVVAAAGYTFFRAVHLHTEQIHVPPRLLFAFVLVFVLAAGVVWELLEFVVDRTTIYLEMDPVLAQHGIHDTIVDMLFNVVGALITALWATIYLTDVSEAMAERIEELT